MIPIGQSIKKMFRPETRGKRKKKKRDKVERRDQGEGALIFRVVASGPPPIESPLHVVLRRLLIPPLTFSTLGYAHDHRHTNFTLESVFHLLYILLQFELLYCYIYIYRYISVYVGHSTMVMCLLTWKSTYKNLVF